MKKIAIIGAHYLPSTLIVGQEGAKMLDEVFKEEAQKTMVLTNPYKDLPKEHFLGEPKDGRALRRERRKKQPKT